jgi:Protein of unknown function (DUF3426).
MILTCPSCTTRYEVDVAKFPPAGRDVRCVKCGHVWHAMAELDEVPETEFSTAFAEETQDFVPQRDPEPQIEAEEESSRRRVRTVTVDPVPWYSRKAILTAGWLGLVAVVIVIGAIATVYRSEVVGSWPKSATAYSTIGVKMEPSGLKISDVSSSEAPQNGQIVLTVAGALTNVTSHELPVPQIRVGLVDRDKRELYHWTVAPQILTLKPGQSTRFVTRLSNPPEKAATYEVRLAKAGE